MSESRQKQSTMTRHTKLTLVGIFLGLLLAVGIGVLLYVLNKENRFQ